MGEGDNPAQNGARRLRLDRLIPGDWHANPLTCRILRNAGFALGDGPTLSHGASAPPPIRTGLDVIGVDRRICNGDKSPDTRNQAGKG